MIMLVVIITVVCALSIFHLFLYVPYSSWALRRCSTSHTRLPGVFKDFRFSPSFTFLFKIFFPVEMNGEAPTNTDFSVFILNQTKEKSQEIWYTEGGKDHDLILPGFMLAPVML